MNNTINKFEKKIKNLDDASIALNADPKHLGYNPNSPKKAVSKQISQPLKKRVMTSKPYVAQSGKFDGQCPLDYGRINKVNSNQNSVMYQKKSSTVDFGNGAHQKSV